MKILLKLISILVSLTLTFAAVPQPALQSLSVFNEPESDKVLTGASSQGEMVTPQADEISNNGAFAAVVSVPPVIRVANAGYGLTNQALTPTDSSTIQTQLINYAARTMQDYNTTVSVKVPAGATAPVLVASTQGAGSVNLTAISLSGNPYTWKVTGGIAVAGNYIDYTITYNLNGRQYTQKAASYVDHVELAAGWQTYVVRRNFSDVTHTRHEYTATLSGSGSSGAGYAVYGSGGSGYYNMSAGGGTSGFTANPSAYSGMKLWNEGYDKRENCSVWYCGQPGKNNKDDNVDGGHRANLDVYYDPSVVTNISQLGIKLLYWRSTSPPKTPTLSQEKMIYLQGNPLFSNDDSSNATAQSYFYSTNALNNNTQSINSDPGTMVFNFAGTVLPPDGKQVTFASAIYGNFQQQVHLTTWNAWLITFHVVNKAALRSLIAAEDSAFRQIHDGYTDTGGAFTAYLNALTKSKAVLNQPNASPAQISAAVNNLNSAKNNFTYVSADYAALDTLVDSIYDDSSLGFRPSITKDPDYYYSGVNYYPSHYYIDTSVLKATLTGITYNLDIRYQAYVDTTLAEINTVWRTLVLLDADYTTVNDYINTNTISGQNDATGSDAGNYILANATKYPQYANQMIYWRHFTLSSYNDWDTAVKGATLGLKIPDEAAVAAMGAALESAYNNLTILPPNCTELNAVMADTFTALNSTAYVQNPEGEGHSIAYFTDASVGTMQAKYNEIFYGLDGLLMPEQGTVITWTDQLLALYNAKKMNNADYIYADDQKAIPATYEEEVAFYYTTDSWQALIDARNAVITGKYTDEQSVVNEWAVNIYNARNALTLNEANYAAVDAAILAAGSFVPANYQNWSVVADAIDAIVYGLNIAQQSAVDGYAQAITTAIENLIYTDADLTALNAAIDANAIYIEGVYTPTSWAAFADAFAAGIAIRDASPATNITQQPLVDAATAEIGAAAALLVEAFVGIEVNPAGSAIADVETGYICGLPASGDLYDLTAQGFIDIVGNGHFVYTPCAGGFGTGTKVELVRDADDKVMAVYTIIIFGDINGDGLADGRDACIADMLATGMLTQNDVGDTAYFAADANHDGLVDTADALLLEQAGLFVAQINQN